MGGRVSRVNVVCRNWKDDRVLPRFARYLADVCGWELTAAPLPAPRAHYLMGYFEAQLFREGWPAGPVASLFTHREEQPPNSPKAAYYDEVARKVALRVAMCRLYAAPLEAIGPTVQPPLPVERDRFVIASRPRRRRPLVGLAGFTYANRRKGDDLAAQAVRQMGAAVEWAASGRGWPVPAPKRAWAEMPAFYQGLDVLVCPSLVEGGPMPVLEALSCGVPVVVPRGVGIIDELPEVEGIHRYRRGDVGDLCAALRAAAFPVTPADPAALRAVSAGYTVEAWCSAHVAAMTKLLERAA